MTLSDLIRLKVYISMSEQAENTKEDDTRPHLVFHRIHFYSNYNQP